MSTMANLAFREQNATQEDGLINDQEIDFVQQLETEGILSQREKAILRSSQITTAEELYSLMQSFPSLAKYGVDRARLSNIGARESDPSFIQVANRSKSATNAKKRSQLGAFYPAQAPARLGFKVPLPTDEAAETFASQSLQHYTQTIKYVVPDEKWPIRDQGARGTCVAFAMVACREYIEFSRKGDYLPLSEQFLYWGAKRKDQRPHLSGTFIRYATLACSDYGICEGKHWPYNKDVLTGNETHEGDQSPSDQALEDARSRIYTDKRAIKGQDSGNAEKLLLALQSSQHPIPISVPVFKDEGEESDNWTTDVTLTSGKVLDPPPTSEVVGGHAVCVTGWIPHKSELLGGFFVFRNSWGKDWATNPPNRPRGYGIISASYIDRYLWEMYIE